MSRYGELIAELKTSPQRWLVTGVAGFIGSNLAEHLLGLGQQVVGLDNFATGHRHNLDDLQTKVSEAQWKNFHFLEGDIVSLQTCHSACEGVDYVLHQAALGSVPRSIDDPIGTNAANIDGFVNMLVAARDAKVKRFVYAASSSTYGDAETLPKLEEDIGRPLSPYAVTKYVNELYAGVFQDLYGLESIGLRYFNVFGPRQDPDGAYAAVIPRWIDAVARHERPTVYGDGETTRDFCYVDNAVQANLLAATVTGKAATNEVYNVACNEQTSLNALFEMIRDRAAARDSSVATVEPVYEEFRVGDVRHSLADIGKIERLLGFAVTHPAAAGLDTTVEWFLVRR